MTEQEVMKLRKDFPFLNQRGMVYLDNAATMQKPQAVLDRMKKFYTKENTNPLRGLYDLNVEVTEKLEAAREKVARWIGAEEPAEIIFTSGTTAGINMLALSLTADLASDDDMIVGIDAHHSNLLPWLELSRRIGAHLETVVCHTNGTFDLESLGYKLTPNTKLVALTLMSNVTGVQLNLEEVVDLVREKSPYARIVVDAAQAVAHQEINVVRDDIDALVFSGHKMGAPMGIGVLYGRRDFLNDLQPMFWGGEMVESMEVDFNPEDASLEGRARLAELPGRLEAGTLNVGGVMGLAAAIDYWQEQGPQKLFDYVDELTAYAKHELRAVPGINMIAARHGILSFNIKRVHPHDTAQILNEEQICVRAGYHCAQPLLEHLVGGGPCVRASLAFYNTRAEIDKLVATLKTVQERMKID